MGQPIRTVATILGVLRVVLSLFTIVLAGGSGWELFVLVVALPGLLSGILLIIGGRRSDSRPRAATVFFILAALLGVVTNETDIAFGGTIGVLVSLLVSAVFVLAPLVFAAITFRAHLNTRRVGADGAARKT